MARTQDLVELNTLLWAAEDGAKPTEATQEEVQAEMDDFSAFMSATTA